MPARNTVKEYQENSFYHIYNRGVEKRKIFQDLQDYNVMLSYLANYLIPKDKDNLFKKLSDPQTSHRDKDSILKLLQLNNFSSDINMVAYCLMPNHFHFLLEQKQDAKAIDVFMNSFAARYAVYFNKKYKRVGSLFQGVYKAVLVKTDEQFLYLTGYIHRQAITIKGEAFYSNWQQPSSYPEYLGKRKTPWVKPENILEFFSKDNSNLSYESFVLDSSYYSDISKLLIEG